MKKLIYATVLFAVSVISGCTVYHGPWDSKTYEKAPVYKEDKVYHSTAPLVNVKTTPAPVFKNENKTVTAKTTNTKSATVLKEKVINVNRVSKNEVPNISSSVITNTPIKKEVLIIPIE